MQILFLAAALDVATSPSGWTMACIAAGLNPKGKLTCKLS